MSHFQFEPCSGGSDDSDDEYCFFEDKSSKDQNKEINQLNPNLGIIFVNIANIWYYKIFLIYLDETYFRQSLTENKTKPKYI